MEAGLALAVMPRIHAPDLPTDATWLNVTRPLASDDLRGKVVLLDFWTYACINCLHTLPVLAQVSRELADEPFVVVGVHSPKFPTEADTALVREAIRRHGVTHPVVVDPGHAVWDAYAVRSWPTLVVVGADGVIVGAASGEPDVRPLRETLDRVLDEQRPLLSSRWLPLAPEPGPPGTLAYPGGIAVAEDAVYVSDTGHHQVVAYDRAGCELRRYGSGTPGLVDGDGAEAGLRSPHGLASDGEWLLVADTGNHAVRAVDLATGTVTTLAGTGVRGTTSVGGPATATPLRSPWDVAVHDDGRVLVAMAGSHQLWAVHDGAVTVLAGSGREARRDGDAATAAFAQPSGLARGPDGALYVADSESSAVRRVHGDPVTVETVAGGDLFDFGDIDGKGDEVRLQHPVGIAGGERLLLADTLNHKVKVVDPATGEVRTLLGDGTPFDAATAELEHRSPLPDDLRRAAAFAEPEACAWAGGEVLVVDTGNHRVVAVDPDSGLARVWAGGVTVAGA